MKVLSTIYIDQDLLQACKDQKINMSETISQALRQATELNDTSEVKALKDKVQDKLNEVNVLNMQITAIKDQMKTTRAVIDYLKDRHQDLAIYVKRYHEGDDEVKEMVFKDLKLLDPYLKWPKSAIFEAFKHLGVISAVAQKEGVK